MSVRYTLKNIRTVLIITRRDPNDQELRYLIEDLFPPDSFNKIKSDIPLSADLVARTSHYYSPDDYRRHIKRYITTLGVVSMLTKNWEEYSITYHQYNNILTFIGNIVVFVWNPMISRPLRWRTGDKMVIIFDHGLPKKNMQWDHIRSLYYNTGGEFSKDPRKAYLKRSMPGHWLITRFPSKLARDQGFGKPITMSNSFIPVQNTRDIEMAKSIEAVRERV